MRRKTLIVIIALAMIGVSSTAMARGGGGGGGGKGGSGVGHFGHGHFRYAHLLTGGAYSQAVNVLANSLSNESSKHAGQVNRMNTGFPAEFIQRQTLAIFN